jgi:hypothetical protein
MGFHSLDRGIRWLSCLVPRPADQQLQKCRVLLKAIADSPSIRSHRLPDDDSGRFELAQMVAKMLMAIALGSHISFESGDPTNIGQRLLKPDNIRRISLQPVH